jgi:3-oxoacyl-[acyl-carrier protein] reductase
MKNVVITGGARGIGAAAVRDFAARGDRVWFLYEKSDEAAARLARETGAAAVRCDVADERAVAAAFAQIPDPQVLVCCAGVAHYGLISQITPDEWRRLFAVDVDGIFYCVRAALPAMLQRQSGAIVTVGSMWGEVGASCEAAYSAAKGAVLALTKALAKELGPSGIRVNAVSPGVIDTDMCRGLGAETLAGLADETPLGRLGRPEDVAKAMAYLADAEFVTGQVLGVNGGFCIV